MAKDKNALSEICSSVAEYPTFIAASGEGGVKAIYADEDVWLSQKMMATLDDVNVRTVNEHLKKIFVDNELYEDSVIWKFRITATDGKNYDTVQNKLHWTIHGQTAAEIFYTSTDAETEFEKSRIVQDRLYKSDFDKQIKVLENKTKKEDGEK